MSRYIDFETIDIRNPSGLSERIPAFNGKRPTRFKEVKGVRLDGEVVDFVDAMVVDRLHKTLTQRRQLRRQNGFIDCIVFASAMEDIEPDIIRRQSRSIEPADTTRLVPSNIGIDTPLNLGSIGRYGRTIFKHVVVPAHTNSLDGPTYMHKLGTEGPICLSGLRAAMDMYDCHRATPLPGRDLIACPVEYPEGAKEDLVLFTDNVEDGLRVG